MTDQANAPVARPALRLFTWWALFLVGAGLGLVYGARMTEVILSPVFDPVRSCTGLGCAAARGYGLLSFMTGPALLLMLIRGLRPKAILVGDPLSPLMTFIFCLLLAVMTSSFHQLWMLPSVR
jgi:hypothetical protein